MDYAAQLLSVQAERDALPGHAYPPDTALAARIRGAPSSTRKPPDQSRSHPAKPKRDMERTQPDGPPHLRRRRLRQNRGRHPRRLQGGAWSGKQVARPRADDRARRSSIARPSANVWRITRSASNCSQPVHPQAPARATIVGKARAARSISSSARTASCRRTSHSRTSGWSSIDEEQRFGVMHKEKFKQLCRARGRADA